MDELIEQMAARAPTGSPCPTCGHETRLVAFGEQWCSWCRLLRPYPHDPRLAEFEVTHPSPREMPAVRRGSRTRAA